jgi:hypothetical protein
MLLASPGLPHSRAWAAGVMSVSGVAKTRTVIFIGRLLCSWGAVVPPLAILILFLAAEVSDLNLVPVDDVVVI